jgi:hypothetical protein
MGEWQWRPGVLVVFFSFHPCDKIPEKNNVREKSFLLAHGFRSFSPWLFGSIVSGPVLRQCIMVE